MPMFALNESKLNLLTYLVNNTAFGPQAWVCRLFKNNITVTNATGWADFEEADFGGYAEIAIDRNLWEIGAVVNDVADYLYPDPPAWTCTGAPAQNVYGWWLYDTDQGVAVFAENFSAPRNMVSGATLTLNPFKIKLATLT